MCVRACECVTRARTHTCNQCMYVTDRTFIEKPVGATLGQSVQAQDDGDAILRRRSAVGKVAIRAAGPTGGPTLRFHDPRCTGSQSVGSNPARRWSTNESLRASNSEPRNKAKSTIAAAVELSICVLWGAAFGDACDSVK